MLKINQLFITTRKDLDDLVKELTFRKFKSNPDNLKQTTLIEIGGSK